MKKALFCLSMLLSFSVYSQEKEKEKVNFYGGFESNSTWYLNDTGLDVVHPDHPLRSNNYLFLNLKYKGWTAGVQGESYEDEALLNYNPRYDKSDIATYFLQYKNSKIDITAGYFYEQFGSGLLFRGWEDRALGINNSLRGGRVIFTPTSYITMKGLYGKQRTGFDVANSDIYGIDAELEISNLVNFETTELSVGFSYVGRDETVLTIPEPNFKSLTTAFAGRINFAHNGFYSFAEYRERRAQSRRLFFDEKKQHKFLKALEDLQKDVTNNYEFIQDLQTDLFNDRIFVIIHEFVASQGKKFTFEFDKNGNIIDWCKSSEYVQLQFE